MYMYMITVKISFSFSLSLSLSCFSQSKGEIDSASKSLHNYRHSTDIIRKSRKAYKASCTELADHQKELERAKLDPNRGKDIEKMEGKIRKLTAHMETSSEWEGLRVGGVAWNSWNRGCGLNYTVLSYARVEPNSSLASTAMSGQYYKY